MTESIEKLEKVVTEWFDKINDKIDWFQDKFATKEELNPIREKQKSHDEIISRIAWASFFWFLAVIWWIVWVTKFM
jgi:hypothetical protein